jgi:ribosomal protein S18 acetylase RimI-like enzyme
MKPLHIRACEAIVAASDPWKRLHETVNFRALLRNRTALKAYVCLTKAQPIGFILFIPEPVFARGGYLRALAVAPDFRGMGVGKKMLSFAEQITAEHSQHFFLCVSSFNRRARAFYKQSGYSKAGRLPGIVRPGETELIFWKKLINRPS